MRSSNVVLVAVMAGLQIMDHRASRAVETQDVRTITARYADFEKAAVQKVPRDSFPVLTNPRMVKAEELEGDGHINDAFPVLGVTIENEARAYPIPKLGFHELVNDTVGRTAIVVSW
ncbi:MAG: DUF3179 domain-containing protein [Planctomycetes bacterium]|nr:DUF3179 domain-containing protein [Planctomycetota bacterium]